MGLLVRLLIGGGQVLWRALQFAKATGLDAILLDAALSIVTDADVRFDDNEDRLAYAVQELMRRCNVPESVARFAVEAAVLALKARRQART